MKAKVMITILAVAALILAAPQVTLGKGPGGGGPPNPGEDSAGNNLSFPAIWADGQMLIPGSASVTKLNNPYDKDGDNEITANDMYLIDGVAYYAYPQKDEENLWQAESVVATGTVVIDEIDWGDSMESVDMKVGRPVRIELSLWKFLDLSMVGFQMQMLANPSSPNEVQGMLATDNPGTIDNALWYDSFWATVYSNKAALVVQKLTGTREEIRDSTCPALIWDNTAKEWVNNESCGSDGLDVGTGLDQTFGAELNVGGKVIYGLSQGGWRPIDAGDYRITFYLNQDPALLPVDFDDLTAIREVVEEATLAAEAEPVGGGLTYVDPDNNITYIDVRVVAGGGGGGGGKGPKK